jgi:hypothetical protein
VFSGRILQIIIDICQKRFIIKLYLAYVNNKKLIFSSSCEGKYNCFSFEMMMIKVTSFGRKEALWGRKFLRERK